MTTDRQKTVRGTADLCVGEILGLGASFARYIILARILGAADFGIAAAFALTVQTLQTISNMALNMLIVQSKDGDAPRMLATAHSMLLLRGLINGVLLLALAWPIAALFGIPEARWAFYVLAFVPLIEGFAHLDVNRIERHLRFRPGIIAAAVPKLLTALAAWPLAAWLNDYSAALWLVMAQSAATVAFSHVLAERPYRLAWDRRRMAEILSFGWPLLLNGVLFFAVSQGDRIIAGAAYSMKDLGIYSAAAGLVMTLSASLFKVVNTLALPPLSRVQSDPAEFARRYRVFMTAFGVIAAVYGFILVATGKPLSTLLYGEQYRAAGALVAWLAAAQAIRLLRLGPSLAAMAQGDTQSLMYANALRLSGVGLAALGASMRLPLVWISAAALVGEIIAFPMPLVMLARRHGISIALGLKPSVGAAFVLALTGTWAATGPSGGAIAGVSIVLFATALVFVAIEFRGNGGFLGYAVKPLRGLCRPATVPMSETSTDKNAAEIQ